MELIATVKSPVFTFALTLSLRFDSFEDVNERSLGTTELKTVLSTDHRSLGYAYVSARSSLSRHLSILVDVGFQYCQYYNGESGIKPRCKHKAGWRSQCRCTKRLTISLPSIFEKMWTLSKTRHQWRQKENELPVHFKCRAMTWQFRVKSESSQLPSGVKPVSVNLGKRIRCYRNKLKKWPCRPFVWRSCSEHVGMPSSNYFFKFVGNRFTWRTHYKALNIDFNC